MTPRRPVSVRRVRRPKIKTGTTRRIMDEDEVIDLVCSDDKAQ